MGTELTSIKGADGTPVAINRYYGGNKGGISVQLTSNTGRINLNYPEIVALMQILQEDILDYSRDEYLTGGHHE